MDAIAKAFNQLSKSKRFDLSSLQFRLTFFITVASLLGLGGLTLWTGWKTQQMIFDTHGNDIESVVARLPHDPLVRSSPSMSPQDMQTLVVRWSARDRWVWIKQPDGVVVAQSRPLPKVALYAGLLALDGTSSSPRIDLVEGRYIIWCSGSLPVNNQLDQVYVARDVTSDYTMMAGLTRSLWMSTLLALAVLTVVIAWLIGRSLRPLRETKFALNHAVNNPDDAWLDPSQMPGEVKEMAQTWNHLLDRLSKTGEQQRQFTNGVSHELRTPLSVVYGYLQSTLKRGSNLTPQQQQALQIAASETERTIQLLQDLLDLARAECGTAQLDLKPIALNDVVAGIPGMADTPGAHAIGLDLTDEPLVVMGDRHYLSHVLMHLVKNAIQASPEHQPITLRLYRSRNQATIQVCDRGCGISLEHQGRIFDPFYRVDPSRARATGGVGLGLAIAKALVQNMGGTLTLESEPNVGSTFSIALPLMAVT